MLAFGACVALLNVKIPVEIEYATAMLSANLVILHQRRLASHRSQKPASRPSAAAFRRPCYVSHVAMPSRADLLKLDVATRLELIEALWDSIAEDPASAAQVSLTDSERELIDQRLREHEEDPAAARPWAEVRAAILARR